MSNPNTSVTPKMSHCKPIKNCPMAKDNTTKSFVLRVDAETMDALEKWAADEFRSINGQLQWIIAEALRKSGRKTKKKKSED